MGLEISFLPEGYSVKKLLARLSNEQRQIQGIEKGIRLGLLILAAQAVKKIQDNIKEPPKTGRLYVLSPRLARLAGKAVHQASKGGEAPADLTGKLRRSTKWILRGNGEIEFGYGEEYGKYLELGTSKMSMRPNIYPSGHKTAREGQNIFNKQIMDMLRVALQG